MPFDGTQHRHADHTVPVEDRRLIRMLTLHRLRGMRERLNRPSRWCQGIEERSQAVCLVGAFIRVRTDGNCLTLYGSVNAAIRTSAKQHTGQHYANMVQFNDAAQTTHADILAVLDRAIAAEERAGEARPSILKPRSSLRR